MAWVFLQRDEPKNPLTRAKCTSDIYGVGPSNQRAASLVQIAKPLSDITGQRSSLLPILIPSPSLTSHVFFFPSDTFSQTPSVVNTVWSRHFSLSCYLRCVRQTHRAAVQMPARKHALSALRQASWCWPHLVFHYSFILRAGAAGEARRAGQSTMGTEEPFPPRPLLTQISGCTHLPAILLLPIHLSALRVIYSHHNIAFGFPYLLD